MNLFQILALGCVIGLLVVTILAWAKGAATKRDGLMLVLVWIAAAVAIVWPEVTAVVARVMGIGRGADLLLYCAVVVMMVGFLMVYVRLRKLQRDVTLIVRHMASREAIVADTVPADRSPEIPPK